MHAMDEKRATVRIAMLVQALFTSLVMEYCCQPSHADGSKGAKDEITYMW